MVIIACALDYLQNQISCYYGVLLPIVVGYHNIEREWATHGPPWKVLRPARFIKHLQKKNYFCANRIF